MANEVPAVRGFDYSTLRESDAAHARAAAHRIRRQEQKATEAIFEIGKDLLAIKQMLDHGQFVAWVEAECMSAVRTAQNYMKAAQAFDGKYATVAHLAPSTVYALASAPAEAREGIVEQLAAGERPSETEIRDRIWSARQTVKQARLDARMSPRKRRSRQRAEDERRKGWERIQAEAAARDDAIKTAAQMIREALGPRLEEVRSLLETGRAKHFLEYLGSGEAAPA